MRAGIARAWHRLGLRVRLLSVRLFTRTDAGEEDNRRRLHLGMSLVPVVPLATLFGLSDLLGGAGEGLLSIALGLIAIAFLIALPRTRRGAPLFRLAAFLLGLAALFYLWRGQYEGATGVWIFPYPLAVFFLLGRREGTLWVGATLLLSAGLLFVPDAARHSYAPALAARGLASLFLVSLFSFFFEYMRERHYRRVVRQNGRLNQLLGEVKTLSGLLPICANCKRIRDDQGYWDQVEDYIKKRSSATFSHSICPECARELYGVETEHLDSAAHDEQTAPERRIQASPSGGADDEELSPDQQTDDV